MRVASPVWSRRCVRCVLDEHGVHLHDDKSQANVIAEWTGSEFPDRYIVVGGHLDSWDIGEGPTMMVLASSKALKCCGRCTHWGTSRGIRCGWCLFINEENGNNGGKTYALRAREKGRVACGGRGE